MVVERVKFVAATLPDPTDETEKEKMKKKKFSSGSGSHKKFKEEEEENEAAAMNEEEDEEKEAEEERKRNEEAILQSVKSYISTFPSSKEKSTSSCSFKFNKKLQHYLLDDCLIFDKKKIGKKDFKKCKNYLKGLVGAGRERLKGKAEEIVAGKETKKSEMKRAKKILKYIKEEKK